MSNDTSSSLIQVQGLSIHAGKTCLVNNLSLAVQRGKPVTILGETGSGKSLLANAIVGILPKNLSQIGQIELFGQNHAGLSKSELEQLWGRQIAVLPQEPWHALDPIMPSGQQCAEVGELVLKQKPVQAKQDSEKRLSTLGLAGDETKIPIQLSGGMAQRVAFCAATYAGAELVIADEPTKGLDADRRSQIGDLLKQHSAEGGLLTITHDVALAEQLGGEILVMKQGEILERGEAARVLSAPLSEYARELINAAPHHWPQREHQTQHQPTRKPLLKAEGLSKQRGGKVLFSDLDLTLNAGEVVGLCGDSGCGKSTLADILLGLQPADAGTVIRSDELGPCQALKLYQDPPAAFAPGISMRQLLDDLVALHQLDASQMEPMMAQLGLAADLLERTSTQISGGELQRFALLRAMLMRPRLLIADEPTSRLDPITAQEITELLFAMAREQNCAVLLISHERAMLERQCDRVLALTESVATKAQCCI